MGFPKYIIRFSFNPADRVMPINEPVEDLLAGRGLPPQKSTVIMNAADEACLLDRCTIGRRPAGFCGEEVRRDVSLVGPLNL